MPPSDDFGNIRGLLHVMWLVLQVPPAFADPSLQTYAKDYLPEVEGGGTSRSRKKGVCVLCKETEHLYSVRIMKIESSSLYFYVLWFSRMFTQTVLPRPIATKQHVQIRDSICRALCFFKRYVMQIYMSGN